MNSSFLSQAWGVRGLKCTREQYKGNTIILHVQNKKRKKVCPKCGRCSLVKNGKRIGDFLALPIGGRKVILRMQITRYKCRCTDCDYARQEEITFAQRSRRYTRRFARYAVELLRHMNIKDVATLLGVSWDMIKEIHTRYLKCHYAPLLRRAAKHRHRRVCRQKRACLQDHRRQFGNRPDSLCWRGQRGAGT